MVIMGPMLMLEWVLVLLLAAVVLTNLAERLAVPYPSLLAIAGAGPAFLPFASQIRIETDLALALFVAPALLDAAFDTSPRGLRDNAIPVASMAVVAVVLTTAAIAFLGWRFAGLPIAAAIALGAIVAPPDAVAANEVLRHLRIPQRIGLVLQGESMLNDAPALLIYRAAVHAAAGSFSLVGDAPILVLAAVGGLVAGYVLARLYLVASAFVRDPASSTVLQFVGTFGVWDQVIWPRAGLVVGLAIVFAPVNVAAYLYTPPLLRGAAVGLLSLLRNEGGSVGTSLAQTFQERREQFHTLRLGESLDPFNPAVQSFLEQAQARFLQQTGDPAAAQQLAWQALENLRHQQASALAYFDCFWLFAVVMLAVTFVVFLMKRSVAEKGARWRMNRFANASGCML
jgi:hypothetical protein